MLVNFLVSFNIHPPIYRSTFCHYSAHRWLMTAHVISLQFRVTMNRSFVASHSRGTKPPWWRAKVALGQDKQRKLPFKIMYVFCLSCPSATFALQHGGTTWMASCKGLFVSMTLKEIELYIERDSPSFTPYDFLWQWPKLLALPSDWVLPLLAPLAAGYDSTQTYSQTPGKDYFRIPHITLCFPPKFAS